MTILKIIGWWALASIVFVYLLSLLTWAREQRFSPNGRMVDSDPNRYFSIEDGLPGCPRGRVWTDKERAEYRRARERRKLRVIQ